MIGLTVAILPVGTWWPKTKILFRRAPRTRTPIPAKTRIPAEKVTAAIDLYNTSPKDNIFITPYNQEGILPVFLIISNDGDQPITVNNMEVQLVTGRRAKLDGLTTDDVFRRVAHISGSSDAPVRVGPIPLSGNKNKKAQKEYEEIQNAKFEAQAVEPHTTKSGFIFFDVEDVKQPLEGAHIYLTGVRDAGGSELMYFEIPATPPSAAGGASQ